MSAAPLDTVAFAERILALLDEGSFSATYKFAVLLGLMDLCLECTTKQGEPPRTVTTRQLAEKIVELYWRQVARYDASGLILEQNASNSQRKGLGLSATIPRFIAEFRKQEGEGLTLFEARTRARLRFEKLVSDTEWVLIKMPLPKLQRFGRSEDRFVYEIAWDDDVRPGAWRKVKEFDNRIRFVGQAAAHLVKLSGLLRPLIQQRWATKVAGLNRLEIDRLESFLFGLDRTALARISGPLLALAQGRCFYCEQRVEGRAQVHVDHFIPWSRHPDDGIDNLVAAHVKCNLAKKNFLAGHRHLRRWMERSAAAEQELESLSTEVVWPRDRQRTHASARAAYLQTVSRGQRLWCVGTEFELAQRDEIKQALGL